jgi:hypothetical protein
MFLGTGPAQKNADYGEDRQTGGVWLNTSDNPKTGACRLMTAIYLCYWRVQDGQQPGFG